MDQNPSVDVFVLHRDVLMRIFLELPVAGGNWFNVMCTCKLWNEIGRKTFDPSSTNALMYAVCKPNVTCLKMLLKDHRIDPSSNDNYAIQLASGNGHLEVVKELLKDTRVDPSANGNLAIKWASRDGHVGVVRELLKDPRVDPSDQQNRAVVWASEHGHSEVVNLLLEDPRVKSLPLSVNVLQQLGSALFSKRQKIE